MLTDELTTKRKWEILRRMTDQALYEKAPMPLQYSLCLMVINSWISRMIRGAWQMRKMKMIIMKTTARESSFFLLMSFFFCLFWLEFPRCSDTGDRVPWLEGASIKVSSRSPSGRSALVLTGTVELLSLVCQKETHGLNSLFVLPLAFCWHCCCCLRAFFTEQFVFFSDLVDWPKNVILLYFVSLDH